ncbi:Inherit from COG: Type II restriction enzyme, methylase [Seminavis robusta]|uniref:Inherit from COG: Type II restriction enzyme, methylase n=1 Tax=Seminavis robusta TaxID=568900 RepID=A0A9N8HEC7_9STRA|nr:Inherit from COG: Type II restriction enzyme, methylase [Seminavis robusta]|eukprot:Sro466_g148720.1 Inherit from COG: Type II restriction enzyme, methylase (447) ;mRNA; r:3864-5292
MTVTSSSSNDPDISPLVPVIAACGYRQVHIAKTNNSFPAWLVSMPSMPSMPSPPILEKRAAITDGRAFYWRSKRDFILLSLVVAKVLETKKCPCHCCPQSKLRVFPKSSFQKLSDRAPWRRPLDGDAIRRLGLDGDDSNNNSINNFHASMKKNLLQMDQFLQCVHTHTCFPLETDEFDAESVHSLQEAWKTFCRPQDCTAVAASETGTSSSHPNNNEQLLPTPQSLGQYFCTDENANQLVTLLLDKVFHRTSDPSKTDDSNTSKHLVVLEPSCGHGQVVWTLLKHPLFDNLLELYQTVTIIAIDLDPRALAVCRSSYSTNEFIQTKYSDHASKVSIEFHRHNFLTAKRNDFLCHKLHHEVVAIGGPPYGSKPEERELPVQFVRHCVDEWNVTVIAFLLPQRFPNKIRLTSYYYECQQIELEDSTFYFQGTTAVKQPSRIQCWSQRY